MIVTRAKLTLQNGLPNTLNTMNGHLMQLHRASEFSHIRQQIKDAAIENLWKGIEQGQSVDMLTERLPIRSADFSLS